MQPLLAGDHQRTQQSTPRKRSGQCNGGRAALLRLLPLSVPVGLGVIAAVTAKLPVKLCEPIACGAIVLTAALIDGNSRLRGDSVALLGAFVFSAAGDGFLSTKRGHSGFFEIGIGLYLIAHAHYIVYALRNGRIRLAVLAAALLGYGTYLVVVLWPRIGGAALHVAVGLYLVISCVALAAAAGVAPLARGAPWRHRHLCLFATGIILIVYSDTLISLDQFVKYRRLNCLIQPTYYAAHILISAGFLTRPRAGGRGLEVGVES